MAVILACLVSFHPLLARQSFMAPRTRCSRQGRGKVLVFVFVRTDFPISNRYAPLLQEMLSIRPEDATVNNAIAAANLAAGPPDRAVTCLRTALRSRPDYFDAHYNLGTALAMQNNFAAALEEFRAAVRLNPQDANAEANLGAALAELGNWKEARVHLEKALAINPNLTNARDNLEQVKRELPNDR